MLTALHPSATYYTPIDNLKSKQRQNIHYPAYASMEVCPEFTDVEMMDIGGRKRKSKPMRSYQQPLTCEDKYLEGVVKLDVYSQYLANPSTLLDTRPTKNVPARSPNLSTPKASRQQPHCILIDNSDLPTLDLSNYRNTKNAPSIVWKKGGVLEISPDEEMYNMLTAEELTISSTLRVLPAQYMHIKETMLGQVMKRGAFKKRDAKSWFRIDVNKTAILYDWFKALGWIPEEE